MLIRLRDGSIVEEHALSSRLRAEFGLGDP
jgi:hypothetical protein